MQAAGFAPIVGTNARILVLGTLPGQASLARGEYYGQPRNAFWKIMGELFGAGPETPYEERTCRLTASGIALWDVCASAFRPGSLDSSIEPSSIVANDIPAFLRAHRAVDLVCFNGAKAAALYRSRIGPALPRTRILQYEILPSTSPAHAGMSYAAKRDRWSRVLRRDHES